MNQDNRHIDKKDDFDIKYVLSQFVKRWYWFVLTVPFFIGLAVRQNQLAIPQYHISSKILIEVASDRVIYNEDAASGVNMLSRSKTVNNEIQVLQSRDLIARAIDSLNLNVSYYQGKSLSQAVFGDALPFDLRADFDKASRLEGTAFYMEFDGDRSYQLTANDEFLGTYGLGQIVQYMNFSFIIDRKPQTAYETIESNGLTFFIDTDESVIQKYKNLLQVIESDKDTDAIVLALDETLPERGALFLNQMLESYFMKLLEDRKRAAETTYEFIDERLKLNFTYLDSLELEIDNFKRDNDIVDPETEARYILQGIKQFEVELSDAETQLEIVSDLVSRALSNPNQEMDLSVPNTSLGVSDPLLNKLIADLSTKQYRLKTLSKTVRPENPMYQELSAEIADLRASIMVDLMNLQDNMRTSVRYISDQISEYKSRLNSLTQDEKGLIALERVRANKEELYIFLLKKREEAAMMLASELMDTWVIEKPHASALFYNPKRGIVLLIGAFLGFFIPISLILLWMLLDGKIRRVSEIESVLTAPVLGQVRYWRGKLDPSRGIDVLSIDTIEDYKQLAFNLRFQYPELQTLLMTSMQGGVGKTSSGIDLALSQAALGKKTCFLELDLRGPILSNLLADRPASGAVEYLMGEVDLDAAISQHPSVDTLDFLSAGQCPMDPTRLMIDQELDKLMNTLRKRYDFIVIDSPPLQAVSDALHLARLADATLMVLRQGHSKQSALGTIQELIQTKQLQNVGVLYTGVKTDRKSALRKGIKRKPTGIRAMFSRLFKRNTTAWRS